MLFRKKVQNSDYAVTEEIPAAAMQMPVSPPKGGKRVAELTTLVRTATGNRKYQQDAVYVTPSRILASNEITRVLALVCDGMGGMADGGRASRTAIL